MFSSLVITGVFFLVQVTRVQYGRKVIWKTWHLYTWVEIVEAQSSKIDALQAVIFAKLHLPWKLPAPATFQC